MFSGFYELYDRDEASRLWVSYETLSGIRNYLITGITTVGKKISFSQLRENFRENNISICRETYALLKNAEAETYATLAWSIL